MKYKALKNIVVNVAETNRKWRCYFSTTHLLVSTLNRLSLDSTCRCEKNAACGKQVCVSGVINEVTPPPPFLLKQLLEAGMAVHSDISLMLTAVS